MLEQLKIEIYTSGSIFLLLAIRFGIRWLTKKTSKKE